MSFGTILLHLNGGERDAANLQYAVALAEEHKAHLVALRTITPFYPTIGAFGDAAVGVIAELQERYRASERAAAETFRAEAEKAASNAGVPLEWREEEDFADDILPVHARYADVTVLGQPERGEIEPTHSAELPANVVMGSGRPAIAVPYAGSFAKPPRHALIAWNGTREATRAVHDALPILKRANKVSILSVNPKDGKHLAGADIAAHLARHGCKAEASRTVATDISVADAILSDASDIGADFLVMGAYGHSRLREWALGGATKDVLNTMTVPVLFSH
ncbi:MAG: universal stress protein [Alphaproteobacteria bacterium]